MKQFVYIKNDYKSEGFTIQQYEIGIISSGSINKDSLVSVKFFSLDNDVKIDSNLIAIFDPEKTGDQFQKKVCNVCHRLLDTTNFAKNQNGKNNRTVRRPSCNDCRKLIDGTDVSSADKRKWGACKPNLEFWECPICKKRTIPGLTSKVVLDHNHKTGKPRAWICDSCNTGLGRFKDDTKTIQNAINYLNDKDKK